MTATIIPFDNKKEPVCSFCKKPKSKVKRMVSAENGRAICDVCLAKCVKLVVDDATKGNELQPS